jgi:multiple sugar transport system permease protein
LFLLPVTTLVVVFLLYPFGSAIYSSFFKQRLGIGELTFCGFKNYISVFTDSYFQTSVVRSMSWAAGNMALQMTIPLLLALLLNRDFRGKLIVLGIILIPWITPPAGLAMIVKWFLEPQIGIVNVGLRQLGLLKGSINFLGSPSLALPSLLLVSTWQFMPFGILLLLSALSTIPQSAYDAMRVDGANGVQIFFNLQLPIIGSMIGFVFFLGFIWTFNKFDLIDITTSGGPLNATMILPQLIYNKAFESFNTSEATTMSSVLGIFLFIIGVFFFKYVYKARNF